MHGFDQQLLSTECISNHRILLLSAEHFTDIFILCVNTLILLELFFYGLGTAVFLQPDKVVHLIDRSVG